MIRPCSTVPLSAIFRSASRLPATGAPANTYGGTHAPDIVGNIRVDQAWGLFQISAAAHLVNASYNILTATTGAPNNLSEISGHPDDKWGGSVMAALQIKNLPTGAGDDFKIDVSYAKGDTKNVISTSGSFADLPDVRQHRCSGRVTRASASVLQLTPSTRVGSMAVPRRA